MTDSTTPDMARAGNAREHDDPEQLVADGLEEVAARPHLHPNDDPEQLVADGLEEVAARPHLHPNDDPEQLHADGLGSRDPGIDR